MKIDWKNIAAHGLLLASILSCALLAGRPYFSDEIALALLFVLAIVLAIFAVLSCCGRIGRNILALLFLIEIGLPITCGILMAFGPQEIDPSWGFITFCCSLTLIVGIPYALLKLEKRFEKLNVRFLAIALFIFIFGLVINSPLTKFLNSLGTLWPDTYRLATGTMDVVNDHAIITLLICAGYYFLSVKVLNTQTLKMVNTVLLLSLAVIFEGIFMPCAIILYTSFLSALT